MHQKYLFNLAGWAVLSLSLLLIPIQSFARDVTFQWTASPETLTGYKLYYSVGEGSTAPPYVGAGLSEGASPILLDKVTTFKMTGLAPDETYHFVLTAYNQAGESGYSKVVTVLPGPSPIILNIATN